MHLAVYVVSNSSHSQVNKDFSYTLAMIAISMQSVFKILNNNFLILTIN